MEQPEQGCSIRTRLCPFLAAGLAPYSGHGEETRLPQKIRQNPEIQSPSPSRPDVQPIGPALAELLNPAINRGDAGMGSGTGLQPPPDNSWDRRAGGEAAAHRARASTRGTSEDVAKRDGRLAARRVALPHPTLPRKRERAPDGSRRVLRKEICP